MAEKSLLRVEVGVHAVRKKPGRNGVVWSGQALEKYKQRKREKVPGLIRRQKSLRQKSNAGKREKKGQRVELHRMAAEDNTREKERMIERNSGVGGNEARTRRRSTADRRRPPFLKVVSGVVN